MIEAERDPLKAQYELAVAFQHLLGNFIALYGPDFPLLFISPSH
jgi:hypothetical protein